MEGSSSDSDSPPEVPEEEGTPTLKPLKYPPIQTHNNATSRVNQPFLRHYGSKVATRAHTQQHNAQRLLPATASEISTTRKERSTLAFNQTKAVGLMSLHEDNNAILRAVPETVEFQVDFKDPNKIEAVTPLQQDVVLQNVSSYTVSFGILPPSSSAFSLTIPHKKSFLPSGMQQRIQISFNPLVCAPQSEFIRIIFSTKAPEHSSSPIKKKGDDGSACAQTPMYLKLIHLKAIAYCTPSKQHAMIPSSSSSNESYGNDDQEDFLLSSIAASVDFGPTHLGTVAQRRLVLPATTLLPIKFTVELKGESGAFSVKPLSGMIGARAPVTLWLRFAPHLRSEYSDELFLYFSSKSTPHRVELLGKGMPAEIGTEPEKPSSNVGRALQSLTKLPASTQGETELADSCGEEAPEEGTPNQNLKQFESCESLHTNEKEKPGPQYCVVASAAPQCVEIPQHLSKQISVAQSCERSSPKRESNVNEENNSITTTNTVKRPENSKCSDETISSQCLDERWADLVAVLRAQKLGTHTVKGAALPSDTAIRKIQVKKAESTQRLLKLLQHQDRIRSSCSFSGAPVVPSSQTNFSAPVIEPGSQEMQDTLRQLWKHELTTKFKQAVAVIIVRNRIAKRLSAMRSWARLRGMREEPVQSITKEKASLKNQQKHLHLSQPPIEEAAGRASQQEVLERKNVIYYTDSNESGLARHGGYTPQTAPTTSQVTSAGLEASTPVKFPEASVGLQGEKFDLVNTESSWTVKLSPPRLSLSTDSREEWERQSIPEPQFWGKEHLNVGELLTCMQHNAALSPLAKCDADVFRLKETDFVTCTGGLEVTDADLLHSFLDATPPLIDDKPWVTPMIDSSPTPQSAHDMLSWKSKSEGSTVSLEAPSLLPPEDPDELATLTWRFTMPAAPGSSACMPLPPVVETDLAHFFLRVGKTVCSV
ncbi:hypothetical protein, conserved [Eimeria tenella]|uniref:Abnormal spindle-like microcephaly-associated protein ASH domain-containing protein n=1 Tax=Eimeria tenella TaxID=5802 RepID=U6KPU8_EIMTE|nr:hypothetical protein, conserved [Eimeria tenella]CDJ37468.1 hypothetical protein, conserved [Eimeria tenella]|eukprot:XP_013228306.1 hypothetical protein, conserved [Eimeria tenella]